MKENMGSFDLRLDDEDMLEIEKLEEMKIMRGEFHVNETTSPYKTIEELWDGEIWSQRQGCDHLLHRGRTEFKKKLFQLKHLVSSFPNPNSDDLEWS